MALVEKLQILERLAEVNEAQGKIDQAEDYLKNALEISRSPDMPQAQSVSFVRKYLDFANRHNRSESAQSLLRTLIDSLSGSPEAYDWSQQLRLTLARNLMSADRLSEAGEVLHQGFTLVRSQGKERYTPVVNSLVVLYGELLFKRQNYAASEDVLKFALSMEA